MKKRLRLEKESISQMVEVILVFLISLCVCFSFSGTVLNEDNCNYAVEELHAYDNELFDGNINTVGAEYSPRYYANALMSFLIQLLGCSWFGAAAVLIRFNYVLYSLAISLMTLKLFEKNRLLACLLLSAGVMSGNSLISLGFGLNGAPDVFLGTAIPIAFMALICVLGERKNWTAAWVLSAVASFLHVHEGMWVGAVIGIIWLAISIADKQIDWKSLLSFPIYVISLLLIVVPSLLHTEKVDEAYFNEIYVMIRTPHHFLLSYWGMRQILISLLLLAFPAAIFFAVQYGHKIEKKDKRSICVVGGLAAAYVLFLIVEYITTEVIPISLVITMYLPKCFKYFTLLGIFLYVRLGLKYIEEKRYIMGMSLLTMIVLPQLATNSIYFAGAVVCAIIFLLSWKFHWEDKIIEFYDDRSDEVMKILIYAGLFILLNHNMVGAGPKVYLLYAGILLYEFLNPIVKIKNIVIGTVATLLMLSVIFSWNGKVIHIGEEGIQYISGTTMVINAAGNEIYDLAMEFRKLTDNQDGFLADPDSSYANYFQMISQRNCYCLYKNMPSRKNSVIEWYERIINVRKMTTCSAEELAELLDEISLEYVLVTEDRYEILNRSELFETVAINGGYGIYRVKD